MSNLTIAWILLTIPVGIILTGILLGLAKSREGKFPAFIMFILVWWGIYFLIV